MPSNLLGRQDRTLANPRVSVDRVPGGSHIRLEPPGPTFEIACWAAIYAGVVAVAAWALVSSGFGIIAWVATVPFAAAGGRLLYVMVLYSRMRVDIRIDHTHFEVRARALRSDDTIRGASPKLKVTGPVALALLADAPVLHEPHYRLRVLPLMFIRFQYEDQELEIGHGLPEGSLSEAVRELKVYLSAT